MIRVAVLRNETYFAGCSHFKYLLSPESSSNLGELAASVQATGSACQGLSPFSLLKTATYCLLWILSLPLTIQPLLFLGVLEKTGVVF